MLAFDSNHGDAASWSFNGFFCVSVIRHWTFARRLLWKNKLAVDSDVEFRNNFKPKREGGRFLSIVAGDPAFVGENITLTVEKFSGANY